MALLSSTGLVVAGGEPAEHLLAHLVAAGFGKVIIIGNPARSALSASPPPLILNRFDNPDVTLVMHDRQNEISDALLSQVDLVVEDSLDWQFKLILSDLCMRSGLPLIHCGSQGLRMQFFTMVPGKSSCLRCALPKAGIDDFPITPVAPNTFRPVAALAGALMALEAIKLVAGLGASQGNEMWKIDGLSGEIEIIRGLDPQFDCPDCGRAAIT